MDCNLQHQCIEAFKIVERTILEGEYIVENTYIHGAIHTTQFRYVLGDLTVIYFVHTSQFWYQKAGGGNPIKASPEHHIRLLDLKRARGTLELAYAKQERQKKFADYILG